jgi:hypothetical protein
MRAKNTRAAGSSVASAALPSRSTDTHIELRPRTDTAVAPAAIAHVDRPRAPAETQRHAALSRSAHAVPTLHNAPPTAPGQSCTAQCNGNVDCILHCPYASDTGDGPAMRSAPTREQVLMAMRDVRGAVMMCAMGIDHAPSTAPVSVIFGSDGLPQSVSAEGPFAGTGAGACIERAVRRAHVPSFTRSSFRVNYPFSL